MEAHRVCLAIIAPLKQLRDALDQAGYTVLNVVPQTHPLDLSTGQR